MDERKDRRVTPVACLRPSEMLRKELKTHPTTSCAYSLDITVNYTAVILMWLTILPNSGLQIIMTQNIITLESFTKLAVYVCQELIVWGSKLSPVFYEPLNEQETMRTILP